MTVIDQFKLDGQVALVTGGNRGIGKAIAIALAEAGADLVISGRDKEALEETSHEIESLNRKVLPICCNIRSVDAIDRMIIDIESHFGKLDIAINNAGICYVREGDKIEEEEWDAIMDTNLKGAYFCCQKEALLMFKKNYGKIVNITSMSGHIVNFPDVHAHYNTSKAGLIQLTRCLAFEWASKGICVNCISPGFIATEMVNDPSIKKYHKDWIPKIPLGRIGECSELVGAALFFSSKASSYATGSDLIVDGGYVLG